MPLAIYTSAAWTANGGIEPAAGATVEVRSEATGSLSILSKDRDGEVGKDNPFTADTQGRFAFFLAGGAYRVKVTDGENEHTLRWQAVGTAGERDVGAGASEVPTNEDLPNSSSTGTQADHESPEGKELLARLDHIESALGIDTSGPAGESVLAAVGRGAIVESGSNSNGHYVRWENGEQVCWNNSASTLDIDQNLTTNLWNSEFKRADFPADFVSAPAVGAFVGDGGGARHWFSPRGQETDRLFVKGYSERESVDVPWGFYAWGFWK